MSCAVLGEGFLSVCDLLAKKIADTIQPLIATLSKDIASAFSEKADLVSLTAAARKASLQVASKTVETVLSEHATRDSQSSTFRSMGTRERELRTMVGSICYAREAFYDANNHRLVFPSDAKLGIIPGSIQADVKENLRLLSIDIPFAEAQQKFEKLTYISVSEGLVHSTTIELGKIATLENVLPAKDEIDEIIDSFHSKHPNEEIHLVIGVDGAHEPLRSEEGRRSGKRGEGFWKECKGFRLYAAAGEVIKQIASWHQISDDKSLEAALKEMSKRIEHRSEVVVAVADGAKWIWKCFERTFPSSTGVLDWFHCVENLAKYTAVQFGDEKKEGHHWLNKAKELLMENRASEIIDELYLLKTERTEVQAEAKRLAEYLMTNVHRIQYGSFRKRSLTIGSGGMESANRFLCHTRLKRSGCWWKPSHANEMLRLRCAKANGTLQELECLWRNSRTKALS